MSKKIQRILDFMENDLERKSREGIASTLPKELMNTLSRPTVIKEQSELETSHQNDITVVSSRFAEGKIQNKGNGWKNQPFPNAKQQGQHERVHRRGEDSKYIGQWITHQRRRRAPSESTDKNCKHRRGNVAIGHSQNPDSQLQAAMRKAWIYVGLHSRTEPETVTNLL
jgi:hypothetical protein